MSRFVLETDSVSLASVKVTSAGDRLRRHGDEIGTAIDLNLDGLPADFKARASTLRGRLDTTRAAAQTYNDKGAALSTAVQGFLAAGTSGGTASSGTSAHAPGAGKHGSGPKGKGSGKGGHVKGKDVDHDGLGDAIGVATAIGIAGAAGGVVVRSPSLTKAISDLLSPRGPAVYASGTSGGKAGRGSSRSGGGTSAAEREFGPKPTTVKPKRPPSHEDTSAADREFGFDNPPVERTTHPKQVQVFVPGPVVLPTVETFVPGDIHLPPARPEVTLPAASVVDRNRIVYAA